MPRIELPLTLEQFQQLPRNPAYKYDYIQGRALLTPWARHFHALLDLSTPRLASTVPVRSLGAHDWETLVPLFAGSFRSSQPFASLDEATLLQASYQALERTRIGGDGPMIDPACFIAPGKTGPTGAILTTLLPDGDPCDLESYVWRDAPPAGCVSLRLGRPHLTWIFVDPFVQGLGTGTALLGAAVQALLHLGYHQLLTTFILGNDASLLWHWRNGFKLLPRANSPR